jgi:PAS domain S-box-containing protein
MLLVIAASAPILVCDLANQFILYRNEITDKGNQTRELARDLVTLVEYDLQLRIAALETLALSGSSQRGDLDELHARADLIISKYFPGSQILLLKAEAQSAVNIWASVGERLPTGPHLDAVQRVLATDSSAVSDLFFNTTDNRPAIAIDVPVNGADGKIRYILSMIPPLDQVGAVILREAVPGNWLFTILDRQSGIIIQYLDGRALAAKERSFSLPLQTRETSENPPTSLWGGERPSVTGFSRGDRFGWGVLIVAPRADLIGPLEFEAELLLFFSWATFVGSLGMAHYAASRITGPINSLQLFAAASDDSALYKPVPSGLPEVDRVARALYDAEERRRRSQKQFRQIVEAVPNAILVIDPDGAIEMANPQAERVFGYLPGELLGRGSEFIVPGLDHSDPEDRLLKVGRQLIGVRKSGNEFPAEAELSWLQTDEGPRILASVVDITNRQNEQKMQSYFTAIVESSTDAIIAKNLDRIVTSWNNAAEKIFGYTEIEMVGQPITRLLPADRIAEEDDIIEKLSHGEQIEHFETVRRRKDGEEIAVSLTISPIHGPDGKVIGASKIARDITIRKQLEQNLRLSRDRFRSIFDAVGEGIFIVSPETGIFITVNEPACMMVEYAADELIGQTMEVISSGLPPFTQSEALKWHQKAISSGAPERFEWQCKAKNGRLFWAEVTIQFATISGEASVIAVVRDISERKAVEEQLRHSQKLEAIGNLTGGMAHDFNNLLTVIIGSLYVARDMVSGDKSLTELLDEADKAAWRGADLTRRLLAFARRQPLRPAQLDINQLVTDTIRLLRRMLGEDIEVSLDLKKDLWPVTADPAQLESSLANLANNARDAMPGGGRLMIATANSVLDAQYVEKQRDASPGDYVMIEVSDNGTGMSVETMTQIFEPFFTTKEPGKGTGLGLSMVFGFTKQSGGHVSVYSEPGAGTTFRLYLPRTLSNSPEVTVNSPAMVPQGAGQTVLVVEDNPSVRRITMRHFSELNYNGLECERAAEALEILQRERVDLLFTDIVMPGGIDGVELARIAQERWPSLKIMLTSGFPFDRVDGQTNQLGSLLLLSKPYRRSDLAAAIRAALEE